MIEEIRISPIENPQRLLFPLPKYQHLLQVAKVFVEGVHSGGHSCIHMINVVAIDYDPLRRAVCVGQLGEV